MRNPKGVSPKKEREELPSRSMGGGPHSLRGMEGKKRGGGVITKEQGPAPEKEKKNVKGHPFNPR